MARALTAIILLTAVYSLTLASLHPLDLAAGVALSAALVALFRRFLFRGPPLPARVLPGRILAFFPFALATLRDIVVGTWDVTLVVLGARPLRTPGIVAIPIEDRSELGVAVSALVATLSPGEFLVDVDRERDVMLFHVIDASDPDAVRERHRRFYRRYQRRVFP